MTTCVICARRQTERGYTCSPCLDRLAQHLHDCEHEATLLSAVPSMAAPAGSRGGTLASHRAPARLDVIALTDPRTRPDWDDTTLSVLGVLGTWARVVREQRALTWPERITVTSERKTLSAQLDWIAAQPWVDDLARDLRALRGQLKACNGTQDPRPEGSCYLPTSGSAASPDRRPCRDHECEGPQQCPRCGGPAPCAYDTCGCDQPPARARYKQTGPLLVSGESTVKATCGGPIWLDTANGHAHCGRCRATWDGPQLAMLAWELDRAKELRERPHTDDGRPMLTAQELVDAGLVSSVSNVRVRAHRLGVRAVGGYYDPAAFGEKVSA
jgi:hypothetical protein